MKTMIIAVIAGAIVTSSVACGTSPENPPVATSSTTSSPSGSNAVLDDFLESLTKPGSPPPSPGPTTWQDMMLPPSHG